MPRAMRRTPGAPRRRRILHPHEAGGPVRISTESMAFGSSRAKSVVLFTVLCDLCVGAFSGCGSRRPVVNRRQTPPTQPSETPTETADAAKRSTDVPETPGPVPATAPSPKRSKPAPAPAPFGYAEQGNASWYGVPFHGRRASNGEIYDMNKLTAAHRTLPFETKVRVTNLNNSQTTE